jgi:DNA damage-regulated autophagy modulator protein 2
MGTVYFWYQTKISIELEPFLTLKKAKLRMVLSIFCTVFFVIVAVTGVISHILFNGTDPRHW